MSKRVQVDRWGNEYTKVLCKRCRGTSFELVDNLPNKYGIKYTNRRCSGGCHGGMVKVYLVE